MIQIGVGAASCLGSVTDHQPSLLVSVSSVPTITIVFVRMKRRHIALVAAEPSITSLCAQAASRHLLEISFFFRACFHLDSLGLD